ncbi:MAG TPA: TonB-dependent receptor, partial [Gammaproteobacteria bacterium]|nr:TonB-dependent receptor [Gammaproteobacteria bacterium]
QQVAQLVPSMNYVSPNPRNTAFTIRGLGSSVVAVSQANDGLEPGVGFYVDGVYHARPATAAFDFVDLDRVEVLRGPQGTLFGKNTTAGAISVVTAAPGFTPDFMFEARGAGDGYRQVMGSASGPLAGDVLAGRFSGSWLERDGVLHDVRTGVDLNMLGTSALRGELLFKPVDGLRFRFIADRSNFDSTCCTQVYFDVAPTLKPAARQYPALAAGQNYAPPSTNPYDRLTDIDGPLLVDTAEGGFSTTIDWDVGGFTLTSISAWRFWKWDAENDRDYTGLSIQTSQHIPSRQDQYSQELRIATRGDRKVDYVAGYYFFKQAIEGHPISVYGALATYWLLGPPATYPANLLDGYRTDGDTRFASDSRAVFGEATWHATQRWDLTLGWRYTWENKDGTYDARVSGGLATTVPALVSAKLSILRPQSYSATVDDASGSGRVVASYRFPGNLLTYVGYSHGEKSGGINMSGLPLNSANLPALATAVVRPERITTTELGAKMQLAKGRVQLNADVYATDVRDFQTNVVDTGPGALRGYLANIEAVSVRGAEIDSSFRIGRHITAYAALAFADGVYDSYRNGPCPIEAIGSATTVCDLSGKPMSSLPGRTVSIGTELTRETRIGGRAREGYVRVDVASRTGTYGDPSDSRYTRIDGYSLVNASIGLRNAGPWEVSLWVRNLLDEHYMQNLTVQAGNSGLIVGTPSDPRTVGVALRARF